jgi:phospholipase C
MKWILLAAAPFTCSPLAETWGLDAIKTMTTPPDPAFTCNVAVPADPSAAQRSACAFNQGDHPSTTLGVPAATAAQFPIRHIIVMMKENRSFDHLFGRLHDEGQPGTELEPSTYVNPDLQGTPVSAFHESTTCVPYDPGHQSDSVVEALSSGAMDGFVRSAAQSTGTDGHFVMGNYEQTDLLFDFWLAATWALSDRHFAPMASGTFGNRNFLLFGTNAGVVDTGVTYPDPSTPSLLQTLMNAGFTWAAYSDSEPFSGALGWGPGNPGVHSFQDFLDAADQGTLPNVAFVDGVENVTDDHPTADLQAGEAWSRQIYQHVIGSPQWPRLAIIWTYDEAGGFADHALPPVGCAAAPSVSPFTQMGPRVPLVVISRWAKLGYVSHVEHDHTAITRFIETIFDLPALTARDANSDALLDLFDFSCAQPVSPPPGAPDAGTGGCTG